MSCRRLLAHAALVLAATVALLASMWTGAASAAGSFDMRGVWVITGQYSQKTTITSMNMATGEFSGTGVATNGTGYTWPSKGSVSGSTVKWVFGPYDQLPGYTATCEGTLSPEGNTINGSCSDTHGLSGAGWTIAREGSRRASSIQLSCSTFNPGQPGEYMQCTAQVGDASGQSPAQTPTGAVTFAIKPGGPGAFQSGNICNLAPSQTGGPTSFCSVNYIPPAGGIPIGSQPPISATYSGDSNFSASSASASSPLGGPPSEEPTLCIDLLASEKCSGVGMTLPEEPTIDEFTSEVSVDCEGSEPPAGAAKAHAASSIPIPSNPQIFMEPPKKPGKCKVQLEIEAAKKAKQQAEKKIKLLEKQHELEVREQPLSEKRRKVEQELKELKKVSQVWGNELTPAPHASTARKHKLHRYAISFGSTQLELSAHTRTNVKLRVPKANRIFLQVLRRVHIRTLPLTLRISVIRSGETKATSTTRTVVYRLNRGKGKRKG